MHTDSRTIPETLNTINGFDCMYLFRDRDKGYKSPDSIWERKICHSSLDASGEEALRQKTITARALICQYLLVLQGATVQPSSRHLSSYRAAMLQAVTNIYGYIIVDLQKRFGSGKLSADA